MNDNKYDANTPQWLTLKEAALLLNCSVKTVRRRIDSGKWRSIVEYKGRKAIRLVSREDVLSETSFLNIRQNIESGPLQLDPVAYQQLGHFLEGASKEINSLVSAKLRRARIYLLVMLGVTVISVLSIIIFFSVEPQLDMMDRMMDRYSDLSDRLSLNYRSISEMHSYAARKFKSSDGVLNRLEKQLVDARLENSFLSYQLSKVNREISELRDDVNEAAAERKLGDESFRIRLIDSLHSSPTPGVSGAAINISPPSPTPEIGEKEDYDKSGFLGIF